MPSYLSYQKIFIIYKFSKLWIYVWMWPANNILIKLNPLVKIDLW